MPILADDRPCGVLCAYCREELGKKELERGCHRRAKTWTKSRDGGGVHGLVMPEPLDEWAHDECVARAKRGQTNQRGFW